MNERLHVTTLLLAMSLAGAGGNYLFGNECWTWFLYSSVFFGLTTLQLYVIELRSRL